jgi:hypothetical protein
MRRAVKSSSSLDDQKLNTKAFMYQTNCNRQLAATLLVSFLVIATIASSLSEVSKVSSKLSLFKVSNSKSARVGTPLSSPSLIVTKQARRAAPPALFCRQDECRHQSQYISLGLVKCGTSTLKEVASAHPRIRTHESAESFYFLDEVSDWRKHHFDNLQNHEGNNATLKVGTNPKDGFLYGEHSPSYLWQVSYKCWGTGENLDCDESGFQPNVTSTISHMAQVLPKETLMIATIRDPTKRAYSLFSHFHPFCPMEWYGAEDRVKCFHDYVLKEIQQIQTCLDTAGWLNVKCVLMPFDHENTGTRLVGIGLYAIILQQWLAHFPNFCILDVSSHGKDLVGIARDLEQCLGLPPEPNLNITYKPRSQTARSQPMWDVTREILDGFYAPYTRLLCQTVPHTCDWDWVKAAFDSQ